METEQTELNSFLSNVTLDRAYFAQGHFWSSYQAHDIDGMNDSLSNGADPNKYQRDLHPPLHVLVTFNDSAMIQTLINKGAAVDLPNAAGQTPLHAAALEGSIDCSNTLLANGADINSKDDFGMTPLAAAAKEANPKVALFLIERGANPNLADQSGRTALHYAAEKGSTDLVSALHDAKADMSVADNQGLTPLKLAVMAGKVQTVQHLLDAGADPSGLMNEKETNEILANPNPRDMDCMKRQECLRRVAIQHEANTIEDKITKNLSNKNSNELSHYTPKQNTTAKNSRSI